MNKFLKIKELIYLNLLLILVWDLERMTAVLQGTHDNYNIDHFKKIINASADITKTSINKKTIASHRVIADHLRASSF